MFYCKDFLFWQLYFFISVSMKRIRSGEGELLEFIWYQRSIGKRPVDFFRERERRRERKREKEREREKKERRKTVRERRERKREKEREKKKERRERKSEREREKESEREVAIFIERNRYTYFIMSHTFLWLKQIQKIVWWKFNEACKKSDSDSCRSACRTEDVT